MREKDGKKERIGIEEKTVKKREKTVKKKRKDSKIREKT